MNKSPLNYLVTVALGAILWVIAAIFIGVTLSQSIIFAAKTPEDFAGNLNLILVIGIICGLFNCIYWYYFGSLNTTAGELDRAKRIWWGSFIIQIVISIILLVIIIVMNMGEGIEIKYWIMVFGLISLLTWIFFWFCTYFMSPRTVKYIPFLK